MKAFRSCYAFKPAKTEKVRLFYYIMVILRYVHGFLIKPDCDRKMDCRMSLPGNCCRRGCNHKCKRRGSG